MIKNNPTPTVTPMIKGKSKLDEDGAPFDLLCDPLGGEFDDCGEEEGGDGALEEDGDRGGGTTDEGGGGG